MKIKSSVLFKFLNKINLDGRVEELVINFGHDNVSCKAVDSSNNVMLESTLNKATIEGYEALGDIGISGLNKFKSIVERFEGDIEFNKVENYLIMKSGRRQGRFILPDTQFIKETRNFPELKFETDFKIGKQIFSDSISNASILGAVKFELSVEKGEFCIKTGDQDQLIETGEIKSSNDVSLVVGDILSNIIKVCDSEVELFMGKEIPLLVKDEKDENIKTRFMLAPIV